MARISTSAIAVLAQAAPPSAVRDSAQLRIVEIFPEVWPPPKVWTIPNTPSSSIGVMDGDPNYTLFRVQGAVGLPDGGTVVAEGDARLRYYDADGRHVRTLDRQGEGPGEAMYFSGLFSGSGDHGRGGRIEAPGSDHRVVGAGPRRHRSGPSSRAQRRILDRSRCGQEIGIIGAARP